MTKEIKPGSAAAKTRRGVDYLPQGETLHRFVSRLQATVLLGCAGAAIGALFTSNLADGRLWRVLGFALVVLLSRWVLRFGAEPAVKLQTLGLWCVNAFSIYQFAGIHSANLIVFPFLIALGGWVLGTRWLYGLTGVTVLYLAALALAEHQGLYRPTDRADAILVFVVSATVLTVSAFLTHSAFVGFSSSRQRVLELAEELELQNRELAERERALRLLVDNVPAGIASFDQQSRLRMGNRRYAALFGATPQQLVGRSIQDYAPASALAHLMPSWQRCLLEGKPQQYRRSNVDPATGVESVLDVELVPDLEAGAVNGIFALLVDVSDKVKTEHQLAQQNAALLQREQQIGELNETLERRVQERSAELQRTRGELQQSQQGLARAERMAALGALVAGVSHELNTPIGNSVMAASTLADHSRTLLQGVAQGALKRSQLNAFFEQVREGSVLLQRNLQRAEDLLRSFKQVAVDQTSEQRRSFDLRQVIEEIVQTLAPSLKGKAQCLQTELAEGIAMDSYPGPLGQVLINLINNAYLHAFEGMGQEGSLSLRSARDDSAEGIAAVLVSVQDNGVGIPPAQLARVFEPFFTTRMGQGGTGLGLNIAYNMVTGLLGGRIEVRSAPGQGSVFEVWLPLTAPLTGSP